jgi:hypothetical protein
MPIARNVAAVPPLWHLLEPGAATACKAGAIGGELG